MPENPGTASWVCLERTRARSAQATGVPGRSAVAGERRGLAARKAGQSLPGPGAQGSEEDELALSLEQERLLLRGWVSQWPHQPPAAEAASDRVPPELTLQYS